MFHTILLISRCSQVPALYIGCTFAQPSCTSVAVADAQDCPSPHLVEPCVTTLEINTLIHITGSVNSSVVQIVQCYTDDGATLSSTLTPGTINITYTVLEGSVKIFCNSTCAPTEEHRQSNIITIIGEEMQTSSICPSSSLISSSTCPQLFSTATSTPQDTSTQGPDTEGTGGAAEPLTVSPSPTSSPSLTGTFRTTELLVVFGVSTFILMVTAAASIGVIICVYRCKRKRSKCNRKRDEPLISPQTCDTPEVNVDVSGATPQLHKQCGLLNRFQHQQSRPMSPNPTSLAISNINLEDYDVQPNLDELQEQPPPTILFSAHQILHEDYQSSASASAEQLPMTTYIPPHPPLYEHSQSSSSASAEQLPQTTYFSPHPPSYEHLHSLVSASNLGISNTIDDDDASDYDVYKYRYDICTEPSHSFLYESDPLSSFSVPPNRPRKRSKSLNHTTHTTEQRLNLPAQERIVPPCIKPTATLCRCTSQGVEYNDEWNDFTLKIPEGAIPKGESLTIDIGVALYGPFQYPEGLRPVSPVFWICVRDKEYFHFLKPVEVTLPHFLTLDRQEDVQSLGLSFLKGNHEMGWKQKTHFHQAEGTALFIPGSDCGVLHTHHFCYLCITSNVSKESIRKAKFCMFATIPRVFHTQQQIYALFFVTFFLKTCLQTIKEQIRNTPELPAGSFREAKKDFQFADMSEPALEIEMPQLPPVGWTLGLEFDTKITQSEMDFTEMDEDELELMEVEQVYPPKFRVVITCSPAAQQSQARIQFKGALKELVFDIPLAPQPSEPETSPQQTPVKQKCAVLSNPVSLPDVLNHIAVRILSKWKMFGIQLDIPFTELDTYPCHDCLECYARVFASWERKGSPELSWGTVIGVLESPIINERRLAEEVREKMALYTSSPSHTYY